MTPRRLIEPARLAGAAVMRTQSDERLVDLVRAGNDRAFDAIVHRYSKALLRYCRRFLPAARAEDVVQQTFMNAYRAICADDRAIELKPWLYRIAHNAALNALRGGPGLDTEPISEDVDGVERPDQAVERRERLAHVVAAVQALPPRQRDAIVLRELEGRSYEEIATELHVSGGAVRQLLSRARMTLRAGATAVVPEWALIRLATSGAGEPVAGRVAEAVAAGGGAAALAKAGAAVFVAGAVVAGGPLPVDGGGDRGKQRAAQAATSTQGSGAPASANAPRARAVRAAGGESGSGSGERGRLRGARTRGGDDATGVFVDDHGGHGSRSGTSSGPGIEFGRDDDRHSGGDDDSGSGSSGSGSSGSSSSGSSGSGGDDSLSGGSGSSGSGSSGTGSSGAGSDDSGRSGSGSSGSGDADARSGSNSGPGGSDDTLTAPSDDPVR